MFQGSCYTPGGTVLGNCNFTNFQCVKVSVASDRQAFGFVLISVSVDAAVVALRIFLIWVSFNVAKTIDHQKYRIQNCTALQNEQFNFLSLCADIPLFRRHRRSSTISAASLEQENCLLRPR